MKYTVFILYVLFCSEIVSAQDIKKDILAINKFYNDAESFSMKVKHRFYPDKTSAEVIEEYNGVYKTAGKYFFSDMLGVLSVQDSKLRVNIDKTEKIVQVLNIDTSAVTSFSLADLDKMLKIYASVEYQGIEGNSKVYVFNYKPKTTEYSSIKIYIEKDKYYVTKIVFYYNDSNAFYKFHEKYPSPRLEVTYAEVLRNKSNSLTDFNTSRFVIADKGGFTLSSQYKNYQLINAIPR